MLARVAAGSRRQPLSAVRADPEPRLWPDTRPDRSLDALRPPPLRAKIPSSTIIGYVRTGYGSRSQTDVSNEITQYKQSSGINVNATTGQTAKLDGIFFDEVSDSASSTNLKRYQTYASLARNAFGRPGSAVVFNPGAAVDARFYNWADLVMYFESAYADYATSKLPQNAQLMAKSAIVIHSFPTGSGGSQLLPITLKPLVPASGAVYITDLDITKVDVYSKFGGDWQRLDGDTRATTAVAGAFDTLAMSPSARVTNGGGRVQKRMWRGEQ